MVTSVTTVVLVSPLCVVHDVADDVVVVVSVVCVVVMVVVVSGVVDVCVVVAVVVVGACVVVVVVSVCGTVRVREVTRDREAERAQDKVSGISAVFVIGEERVRVCALA